VWYVLSGRPKLLRPNPPRFDTTQFCTAGAQGHHALGLAKCVKAHEVGPEIINAIITDEKCSAVAAADSKSRNFYS
jgi:hypothetical protein